MGMIRRINFLAGPGAGKSTAAARLFGELKAKGYDVEQVSEFVKKWAYEGRVPESFDQFYAFAKQLGNEEALMRSVSLLITDSPLIVNVAYSKFYGCPYYPQLLDMVEYFERDYPSLNLFIDRTVDYVHKGRYQTLAQAQEFDALLWDLASTHVSQPLYKVDVLNFRDVVSFVEEKLRE
jgi:nicotinamide riboside kinase